MGLVVERLARAFSEDCETLARGLEAILSFPGKTLRVVHLEGCTVTALY